MGKYVMVGNCEPVAWRVRTKRKDGTWSAWWIAETKPDLHDFDGGFGVEIRALSDTATATIEGLRGEVERLRKSLQWLSFCAQTSGGTAGPDLSLMQAIAMAEATLSGDQS